MIFGFLLLMRHPIGILFCFKTKIEDGNLVISRQVLSTAEFGGISLTNEVLLFPLSLRAVQIFVKLSSSCNKFGFKISISFVSDGVY